MSQRPWWSCRARRWGWAAVVVGLSSLLGACGEELTIPVGPECDFRGQAYCEGDQRFYCESAGPVAAVATTEMCEPGGCAPWGCLVCSPGERRCGDRQTVEECANRGLGWRETSSCAPDTEACVRGTCLGLCAVAEEQGSSQSCEFLAVRLDTDSYSPLWLEDPYGVVIGNGQDVAVEVELAVLDGGRRRTEGFRVPPGETLPIVPGAPPRVDGYQRTPDPRNFIYTGSAVTPSAYRIRTSAPVSVAQFSTVDGEPRNIFDSSSSLLLPSAVFGTRYTYFGMPRTLGSVTHPSLTVASLADDTRVWVDLGPEARDVIGLDGEQLGPEDQVEVVLDAFEVLNLQTGDPDEPLRHPAELEADLTGTVVRSSQPVAVFSAHERTKVAEEFSGHSGHSAGGLQTQLIPDAALGVRYLLAAEPDKTAIVNGLIEDPALRAPAFDLRDFFVLVGVAEGTTRVRTSLEAPDDAFELGPGEARRLRGRGPVAVDSDRPVAAFHLFQVQGDFRGEGPFNGGYYPLGGHAMLAIPSVEQLRTDYVFAVPPGHPFDVLTIVGPADATLTLDGAPLPASCRRSTHRLLGPAETAVHQCGLGVPVLDASGQASDDSGDWGVVVVGPGTQADGTHRLEATSPVLAIVSGWGGDFRGRGQYTFVAGMNASPTVLR